MQAVEFTCQYSDQVRKKHKTWHDGRLKLIQSAKRLMLYSGEDKKLLCSTIMTSERELQRILEPEDFGATEHHIFGRYVVIICERVGEHEEPTERKATEPPVMAKRPLAKVPSRKLLKSPVASHGDHPLALKMNTPFKPPRSTAKANRPSIRQRAVREEQRPAGTKARARIRRVKHLPIML
ncbi:hypothetical protein HG536_0E01040 [Torulaspora globosa]|uniref:5'-3' DNA helicase ZGRF1-like N-terminal domain-containing protein n=1 Tax=Torulaspora globosa TaxID=48254 RepID=A0A7G3ZI57_9SACH|nr:uncharacterized protein HG536_0E01040 [Torulaspora globosa]QLL33193.1 hypothetical protein HG536_0E01040 [Torulaspora globosa]